MPWLIVILGYFLGSIPTAYIAGHVVKSIDIRQVGDANVGAANAFRQLGAKIRVAVGILDAGKGGSGDAGWLWHRPALPGGLHPFPQSKADGNTPSLGLKEK